MKDKPGGIFIRSADQISNEDRILFQTVARVIISDNIGTLEEQIKRRSKVKNTVSRILLPAKFYASSTSATIELPTDLLFFNGIGGFSTDGKEYHIIPT